MERTDPPPSGAHRVKGVFLISVHGSCPLLLYTGIREGGDGFHVTVESAGHSGCLCGGPCADGPRHRTDAKEASDFVCYSLLYRRIDTRMPLDPAIPFLRLQGDLADGRPPAAVRGGATSHARVGKSAPLLQDIESCCRLGLGTSCHLHGGSDILYG